MSFTPAASRTARTGPPAITPVPGAAGLSRTSPAPNLPITSCGMVEPLRETLMRFFLAFSMPLRIASGTSPAHDDESRELHDAAALNCLGNAVDCYNRLVELHFGCVNSCQSSSSSLELESTLAGAFGQFLNTAVIDVSASVEDDFLDPLGKSDLGYLLADLTGCFLVTPFVSSMI